MRRREFIALVGVGAAVGRSRLRAQQAANKIHTIGLLQGSKNENTAAFAQGLRDLGYIEGQNARVEARFFGTALDRIDNLAKQLVDIQCGVIVAAGPQAIKAARAATRTIPVVGIDLESDPVSSGWATSLGRPGGNFTGMFLDIPELSGKQIELLKEAVPGDFSPSGSLGFSHRSSSILCYGGGRARYGD